MLSAMQMVREQERQMLENEEDDEELLSVFLEGLGKMSSRLDVLLTQAREAVDIAEKEEREARLNMTGAKEQVGHVFLSHFNCKHLTYL